MTGKRDNSAKRKISVAWPPFAKVLAGVLDRLEEDQYLILQAKHSAHYVQFAGQGSYGLRAETTSNAYLGKAEKLDRDQVQALVKAGWKRPTGKPKKATPQKDPDGSPNFFADFESPVEVAKVAEMAVRTLSGILRIPHPGMLEYKAFNRHGQAIELPQLGLRVAEEGGAPGHGDAAARLRATLREVTGIADLEFDDDGDIGIRYGSIVTFARILGEPETVHFFSPLVREVAEQPEVFERLNEINRRSRQIRFFWREGTLYAAADVPAMPYVADYVAEAFKHFNTMADDMDDLLQAEFGGHTMYAAWVPSTARH